MEGKFLEGATIVEFDNDDAKYQSAIVVEKDDGQYIITVSNDHRFIINEGISKKNRSMKQIKLPEFGKIKKYKTYGNAYIKFWANTITKDEYFVARICGEQKTFEYSQSGVDEMENWLNEKRIEIGKAFRFLEEN